MWSLKHQLPRTCRRLIDQHFDDCAPWCHAHKAIAMDPWGPYVVSMDDDPQPHDLNPSQVGQDAEDDGIVLENISAVSTLSGFDSDGLSGDGDEDAPQFNHLHGFHNPTQPETSTQDDRPSSPKRCKMAHFDQSDVVEVNRAVWPQDRVPVEIFDIITSLLSRAEIKTLRLVCREFDLKVSANYFKNVVVPFHSELYNALVPDETGARQNPSTTLLSNGMRIFEQFGPFMKRFALSLEMDEDALAYPPLKPDQEAVPTFWGIYRWPHANYNRYTDLERIEETADETQTMKQALKHLKNVTNLGLCCDAGLGFLVRADPIARKYTSQTSVFSTQDWRTESRQVMDDDTEGPLVTVADFNGRGRIRSKRSRDKLEFKRAVLEQMVTAAGFSHSGTDEAIALLLATEATDIHELDLDQRPAPDLTETSSRALGMADETVLQGLLENVNRVARESSTNPLPTFSANDPPLQPNELTRAQKELLLELDWAHRAMIQSYVIAMADNAYNGHFSNLTTLIIAKIPSSHVNLLCRHDFWHAFPDLINVSLGVIADWRRVSKPAPGMVDDTTISPLQAVGKVYELLNSYIGQQPRIESLHFEWICGGELAPSFFQRNQYVLPAPFLEDTEDMVSPLGAFRRKRQLLNLPHIKHLSLKNCWASPHVLLQMVRQLGLASLQKLELEAVSLSGPPTFENQNALVVPYGPQGVWNPQANPLGQQQAAAAPHQGVWNFQPIHLGQQQAAAAPNHGNHDHAPPSLAGGDGQQETITLVVPEGVTNPIHAHNHNPTPPASDDGKLSDPFSWAGFLRHFSPENASITSDQEDELDESREKWKKALEGDVSQFIPNNLHLLGEEKKYKIRTLSLKSCGYISIDANTLNTRSLFPPGSTFMGSPAPMPALKDAQKYMQRCLDKLLGRIIPYISPSEMVVLTDMFNMTTGWEGVYGEVTIQQARLDGIEFPGLGRISGVLESGGNN